MNLSDKMVMKCEQILRGLNIVFYIKTNSGVLELMRHAPLDN